MVKCFEKLVLLYLTVNMAFNHQKVHDWLTLKADLFYLKCFKKNIFF